MTAAPQAVPPPPPPPPEKGGMSTGLMCGCGALGCLGATVVVALIIGAYFMLAVNTSDPGPAPDPSGPTSGPQTPGPGQPEPGPTALSNVRVETGTLRQGDQQLNSGEYVDVVTFAGNQGDRVVITLKSTEFSPYLILSFPSDSNPQIDRSARQNGTADAVIDTTLPESGTMRVLVTTETPGESGSYELHIQGAQP